MGPYGLGVAALFHTLHLASAAVEVADDVAHVVLGRDDLDEHDRLEQDWRRLAGRFLEGHGAGDLERHFRRVDFVERTVLQGDPHVDGGIAGEHACGERLLDALVDRRDVLLRDASTRDLVDELVATAGARRFDVDDDVRELAHAAGLLDVAVDDLLDGLRDGLAVGDLWLADVGVDLELAHHAVDDDLEVEFAHPGDDRLRRLFVGADLERRVFLRQRL